MVSKTGLKQQLQKKVDAQKQYREAIHNFDLGYAQLWLETDWKKALGKKNPTIKDREQWIVFREGISQLFEELVTAEYEKDLQKGLYDIMMKED